MTPERIKRIAKKLLGRATHIERTFGAKSDGWETAKILAAAADVIIQAREHVSRDERPSALSMSLVRMDVVLAECQKAWDAEEQRAAKASKSGA